MCIYIDRCDQFDQRIYEREELDLKEREAHFLEFLYHFGERILMHRRRHVALRSLVVFTGLQQVVRLVICLSLNFYKIYFLLM